MNPATGNELEMLLRVHGVTDGPRWLIDMLGLTRLAGGGGRTRHHGPPTQMNSGLS
jgi:hypothetical protein